MRTDTAPVVLLVYNRPEHTRRTLESLSANPEARDTDLHIFADGPKPSASAAEVEQIRAVRSAIRERDWCGRVFITEETGNQGLARSIVGAAKRVLEMAGAVIVLEDDLVLSPHFLRFMNDGLRCYEHDAEVMHLSGYLFPIREPLPETFFLRVALSWGWATWKRAFDLFEPDAAHLLGEIERRRAVDEFNFENAYDFAAQLRGNVAGRLHTWAIHWYATMFLHRGLALHPAHSLVENIGLDGSGTHCRAGGRFSGGHAFQDAVPVRRLPLEESAEARQAVRRAIADPLFTRVRRRIGSLLPLERSR